VTLTSTAATLGAASGAAGLVSGWNIGVLVTTGLSVLGTGIVFLV
jgi:hypothetical protein